jgi:hypothetical protein
VAQILFVVKFQVSPKHHHLAGDADEVRDREMRPLQYGEK